LTQEVALFKGKQLRLLDVAARRKEGGGVLRKVLFFIRCVFGVSILTPMMQNCAKALQRAMAF
jgi:hypothetical protein